MRPEIEIYKGPRFNYFGSFSLSMLLAEQLREQFATAQLGLGNIKGKRRRVLLHLDGADNVTDSTRPRPVADLTDSLGSVHVEYLVNGQLVHEATHGIGELLSSALGTVLHRLDPTERTWGFAFRDFADNTGVRLAPDVAGSIEVDLGEDSRPLPFTIHQVESPAQESIDVGELGIEPTLLGPVSVLLSREVHDLVLTYLPLSEQLEEGGFLLGRIRPTKAGPERHVTEVTHVTPAARAGASAIHFTFTPDSFQEVNRLLSERDQGEELVGWYHTHLFPPTAKIGSDTGLSGIDIDTHLSTFRRPGQVAGLINLFDRRRVLRFYSKAGDNLKECPLWIGDDRSGYRTAGTQLDSV